MEIAIDEVFQLMRALNQQVSTHLLSVSTRPGLQTDAKVYFMNL
ncbi:MAG: hypothetical protein QGF78_04980 [Candidatus Bathyarchaeota archaeon]|jgi:hypothetical protein|nr:hypothetical protein [Candidatus Bathyarchaeota archaeon]